MGYSWLDQLYLELRTYLLPMCELKKLRFRRLTVDFVSGIEKKATPVNKGS